MSALATPAPYGRACNNCAKAKCKCILRHIEGPCERCLRLHKDCQPAPSVRKKPGRRPVSKTAQLQEKLDDLVTLLRSSASTRAAADTFFAGDADAGAQQPVQPHSGGISEASVPVGGVHCAEPGPSAAFIDHAAAYASPVSVTSVYDDVSAQEAEECLELFRSHKLKWFQFVHIPASATAAQLREERPFLWLSILAATVKSATKQHAFGVLFRNMIAERVVAQHQRSFDILLGLLGFLGWATYHFGPHPFMTMYSHLTIAIVQDLSIDKPPPRPSDIHPMACVTRYGFVVKVPPSLVRTMEERRAVLACYLVTASFLRRSLTLPWNAHMDEALKILEDAQETPLDRVLVQQVKLQRISDSTPTSVLTDVELSGQTKLVRDFQTRALLSKLEEVKQSLPSDLPDDLAAICRYHAITTEGEINEVALFPAGPRGSSPDLQRISMLSAALQLTKTWFDDFLSLPPAECFMLAFPAYSQLAYFTVVIYRLSTLEDPHWDRAAVRQTYDALQLLDALTAKMSQVAAASGIISDRPDGDTFTKTGKTIEPIKAAWEPILNQVSGQVKSASVSFEPNVLDNFSFDVADGLNGWLTDMFTPGWDSMA